MDGGVKKWFMLQMWRIQQVAQVITIAMLAFNLALLLQTKMDWREGTIWADTYAGVFVIMLVLLMATWIFAIAWDLKLKMWREQQTVLIERNPYAKEKMNAKEVAVYTMIWLPVMEMAGQNDPKAKVSAQALRNWINNELKNDPVLNREVKDVLGYLNVTEQDFRERLAK